jgi:hypothetical protein
MGFANAQQMILYAEAMYGPIRPVTNQTSRMKAVHHVINAAQEFKYLPASVRQQKLQELKKQTQKYTKFRKDLGTLLVNLQIATSPAHAAALLDYVEHLAKTKFRLVDNATALAFFMKYYEHPAFQSGFANYVTDHAPDFYEYLLQLNPGPVSHGMVQGQIQKLKKIPAKQYLQGKGQANPCPICMEDFKQSQTLVQLPCHHVFHQDQIKKWLKTSKTCPLCGAQN